MTKGKKLLLILGVVVLVIALGVGLALWALQGTKGTEPQSGDTATYTIEVKSASDIPLKEVGLYIYEDSSKSELVSFIKTDEAGKATFTDVKRDTYVAVIDKAPTGYAVEEQYPLTGEHTTIVLQIGSMENADLENLTYKLGDAMLDFSVVAPDGKTYTLSELFKGKKAVVLNFFYNNCQPCMLEFPFLQEAYAEYSDSISVLAMNPVDGDSASVAALQQEMGITFPMVKCGEEWGKIMQITAYPTTVIIDRFGNICLIHTGSVPDAKTFKDAFAYFSAEDYEQKLIKDIADLEVESEEGTKDNPFEIGGLSSFEVTVEPGQEVYVNLFKVIKKYLHIESKDAYVIYNGQTYKPQNGEISLMVSAPDTFSHAKIIIGNTGKEKQTFKVQLGSLKGSFDNPYTLKLGEMDVNVAAGNEQGVYYIYVPTEDGTLTMECLSATKGVKYSYFLFNTITSKMNNLEADAEIDETTGAVTVSMTAKKGQMIQLCFCTLPDGGNSYPAAKFKFKATFTAGEVKEEEEVKKTDFAVTVLDDENQPVPNVSLTVLLKELVKPETPEAPENTETPDTSETPEAPETPETPETPEIPEQPTGFATDKDGVAKFSLLPGIYDGTMIVPEGYTAEVTTFQLTPEAAEVTLILTKIKKADYVVTVKDPAGAPVPGVLVQLGGAWLTTDDAGKVTKNMEVGVYTITIMIPEGYSGETVYAFPENATELTVDLGYPEGSEKNPIAVTEYPFTTAKLDGGKELYYSISCPAGAIGIAIRDAEAYIRCDGITYGADNSGVVEFLFDAAQEGPVVLVIGNGGTARESYIVESIYPLGSEQNPILVGAYPYTTAAMAPGQTLYYQFAQVEKVLGFTVTDADIQVTYVETAYVPEGGVLNFPFPEANTVLAVQNCGAQEKTFTFVAMMPETGTEENPDVLTSLGNVTKKLETGDADGYYYVYTTDKSGTLTLRLLQNISVAYDVEMQTQSHYRLMSESGVTRQVSIDMEAGETVTIHLFVAAEGYPTANFRMRLSFTEAVIEPPVTDPEETEPSVPESSETETTEPPTTEPPTTEPPTTEPPTTEPPTTEPEPEDTEPSQPDDEIVYTVTVTDSFGAGQKGIGVMFLKGGVPVKMVNTGADGKAILYTDEEATYTVELVFTGKEYYYDKQSAVLTPDNRNLTVKLIANVDTNDFAPIYILNDNPAYTLYVGGTRVQLSSGKPNFSAEYENNCFFVFTPQTAGTYQITVSPAVELSFWGTTNFINKLSDNVVDNAATFSISESSVKHTTYVIGFKATETALDAVVNIARIGDPEFSIADQPWSEWKSGITLTDTWKNRVGLTAMPGNVYFDLKKAPTYFDITAATGTYELWYDEVNGYYCLGKNGPVILVNMNATNRFVPLYERVNGNGQYGGSAVTRYFFDETGKFLRKEAYTEYLQECFAEVNLDAVSEKGYYPLTKDMMYVLQNGFCQWWNVESPNYLEGFAGANAEYAWLFACCYVEN